ncbi:MAG: FecR family protein [Chlorobi bacterium]|nr:FecR family protein [Chlorobiota bacterium]
MDKIYKKFRIAALLIEEIFGQLSTEGETELKNWKEEHQQTYNYLHEWENYKTRKSQLSKIDVSKEWQVFLRRNHQRGGTRFHWGRVFKYAALVFIILSFSSISYWLLYPPEKKVVKEVVPVEIPHGERKAELILSNGQSIQLYPSYVNILKEADGTVIYNDSAMISYEGAGKDDINKSNTILYNTLNIARGGEYFLVLNDGTKVWLNSLSALKYPVVFTGKERIVELTGEAYFEVSHDPAHPFIVKNNSYDIEVLGTSFNISCYDKDDVVTTLAEGHIKILNIKGAEKADYNLSKNDQLILSYTDQSVKVQKVDARTYSSWKNGSFCFENETLGKIFQKLERWYNIDVIFKSEEARSYDFTGILPRFENFEIILEMLETISDVKFSVDGHTVVIDKK